jgi:hypothetical protein
MVGSQLKAMGWHWSKIAKNTATSWARFAALSQRMTLRTLPFFPKSRSRKTRTDALTSARIGLYSSWTPQLQIRALVSSWGGISRWRMPIKLALMTARRTARQRRHSATRFAALCLQK